MSKQYIEIQCPECKWRQPEIVEEYDVVGCERPDCDNTFSPGENVVCRLVRKEDAVTLE